MSRLLFVLEVIVKKIYIIVGVLFLMIGAYALVDAREIAENVDVFATDAILEDDVDDENIIG